MSDPADVLLVDDTPEQLSLLEDLLLRAGHSVRAFTRPTLALVDARRAAPDLILLDINMPEMDGYTACRTLKSIPGLADVPVIFVSARDDSLDKVRGFGAGAADYVTKPVDPAEVHARVATQLNLRRSQQAERQVLEQTLGAAVNALVGVVGLAAPAVDARSRRVTSIVRHVARTLELPEPWRYELAARLCLIGCVALPPPILDDALAGRVMSEAALRVFREHPAIARDILIGIPRLAEVAEMIARQGTPASPDCASPAVLTGARLLRAVIEFDLLLLRGQDALDAVRAMRAGGVTTDAALLGALAGYVKDHAGVDARVLRCSELAPDMVLDEDVATLDGTLVARSGLHLTLAQVARLKAFASARLLPDTIRVLVPISDAPGESIPGAA